MTVYGYLKSLRPEAYGNLNVQFKQVVSILIVGYNYRFSRSCSNSISTPKIINIQCSSYVANKYFLPSYTGFNKVMTRQHFYWPIFIMTSEISNLGNFLGRIKKQPIK